RAAGGRPEVHVRAGGHHAHLPPARPGLPAEGGPRGDQGTQGAPGRLREVGPAGTRPGRRRDHRGRRGWLTAGSAGRSIRISRGCTAMAKSEWSTTAEVPSFGTTPGGGRRRRATR